MSQHVLDLQGVPVEMGAWLHESLLKNKHVLIKDSKRMPRRAKVLQSEFLRQGIYSLLSVPVFYRGKLMFQIGYDAAVAGFDWKETEIRLLREVGRLFALRLLAESVAPAFQPDEEAQELATILLRDSTVHKKGFLDQITHISADGDYSLIHFLGARKVSDSHSLRHWESALTPRRFIRVSRSAIVNLSCVETLDRRGGNWKLGLRGMAEPLPVGRNFRTNLRHRLEC
jgi:DNA-binding LytR/AlgR family response regulator